MSPRDTDFEVLALGRVPDSRTRDQHGQKQSRDNRDSAALLDLTIDYPPNNATVPKELSRSDPPACAGRYDFLDPPRADNELGHLAHYRVPS